MSRFSRVLQSTSAAVILAVVGAASASVFSYGTLTASHDGSVRGKGYGTFSAYGYNQVKLTATLADMTKDGTRTFVSGKGYGGDDYVSVESGRRADGGNTFASMATKYGTAAGSTSGFTGYVKVCQDVSLSPDWCSSTKSGNM